MANRSGCRCTCQRGTEQDRQQQRANHQQSTNGAEQPSSQEAKQDNRAKHVSRRQATQ